MKTAFNDMHPGMGLRERAQKIHPAVAQGTCTGGIDRIDRIAGYTDLLGDLIRRLIWVRGKQEPCKSCYQRA